jgi:RNA polymerase sigma factor (sigma-70 family)
LSNIYLGKLLCEGKNKMNEDQIIDLYYRRLFKYCVKITGSTIDAEDLAQESILKVIKAINNDPSRLISNSFLYTIAKNVWLDMNRKRRVSTSPMSFSEIEASFEEASFQTRELLEVLAMRLPVNYMVVLLLMDIFQFTAKETASVMKLTEGSVRITLNRARKKLKAFNKTDDYSGLAKYKLENQESLINSFVNAFITHNPQEIYHSYLQLTQLGIKISSLKHKDGKYYFTVRDLDGNILTLTS